ncbi:hypothetical protein N658DRAFT_60238 [Parathielavia hyrcaniae]|uniref:Uncharacterized protein n=1 Tax=Parathielavia hyrcaniae TaxID=113614 RepID=A0AAN6Q0N4_9PEZI|nr:hypothetical protein N658DRAFT_60238 [Parathielavia hyrcaniae]
MAALRGAAWLLASGLAAAQYRQDYEVNRVPNGLGGTDTTFFWSPARGGTTLDDQVIDISPEVVYLTYNCHHMTSICDNAYIFIQSDRGLHLHGDGDGIAAQVMTYTDKEATNLKHPIVNENQQKRSDGGNASEPVPAWRSGALYEHLLALAEAGHGRRHVAHANETEANASVGQQTWADMGLQTRWQLGDLQNLVRDEENDGDDSFPRAREPKPEPEPAPEPVNHPAAAPVITPLAKRATPSDLKRARAIVKNAIVESARRNEARYKNPLRNQYRLKSGTVIEGETAAERRRRQAGEEAAPPLLYITDEIAAAAALVAEADAVTTFGNQTPVILGQLLDG